MKERKHWHREVGTEKNSGTAIGDQPRASGYTHQCSVHWASMPQPLTTLNNPPPEALGSIPSFASWFLSFLRPNVSAFFLTNGVLGKDKLKTIYWIYKGLTQNNNAAICIKTAKYWNEHKSCQWGRIVVNVCVCSCIFLATVTAVQLASGSCVLKSVCLTWVCNTSCSKFHSFHMFSNCIDWPHLYKVFLPTAIGQQNSSNYMR